MTSHTPRRSRRRWIGTSTFHTLYEDHDILARKLPTISPRLVPGDVAFRDMRASYKRFYAPRATAPAIHARINELSRARRPYGFRNHP